MHITNVELGKISSGAGLRLDSQQVLIMSRLSSGCGNWKRHFSSSINSKRPTGSPHDVLDFNTFSARTVVRTTDSRAFCTGSGQHRLSPYHHLIADSQHNLARDAMQPDPPPTGEPLGFETAHKAPANALRTSRTSAAGTFAEARRRSSSAHGTIWRDEANEGSRTGALA